MLCYIDININININIIIKCYIIFVCVLYYSIKRTALNQSPMEDAPSIPAETLANAMKSSCELFEFKSYGKHYQPSVGLLINFPDSEPEGQRFFCHFIFCLFRIR